MRYIKSKSVQFLFLEYLTLVISFTAAHSDIRWLPIVFFDRNSSTLNTEGMVIVQRAAEVMRRTRYPIRLRINGYTDSWEARTRNHNLSRERACAVALALIQLGVPRDRLDIAANGEKNKRVPTGKGVAEPQNRRVEVVPEDADLYGRRIPFSPTGDGSILTCSWRQP